MRVPGAVQVREHRGHADAAGQTARQALDLGGPRLPGDEVD
jgi:hypothetical protein